MADVKKFLDAEGVKYLWSKVNMQDYPNNETLMAVINAIDETKADTEATEAAINAVQANIDQIVENNIITKASFDSGILSFKNNLDEEKFAIQIPIYNGEVS